MAEYHEDGCILDVTVLEDNSTAELYVYTLQINKIIKSSRIVIDPVVGSTFICDKLKKGVMCMGMWSLYGYKDDKDGC